MDKIPLTDTKPVVITKDLIHHLHFPKEEVLNSSFDKNVRNKDLEQAIVLGNVYHSKVAILFEDIEGQKKVETTIWGVTDKAVILKGDIMIPIHRIIRIIY
ncbi:MAG: hypothetical protein HUJ25_03630 [Crocinitomicaceae bacterium]|nr:hypothetical protein [Crocinitomicaceae bacterium]